MYFLRGTSFWKSQWLGISGFACLVLALVGPVIQSRAGMRAFGLMRAYNGASMLSGFYPVMRPGAFAAFIIGVAFLWALFTLRAEIAKKIALAFVVVAFFLVVTGIKSIDVYNDLTAASLIPVYLPSAAQTALGWAWLFLFCAALLFWLSASAAGEPTTAEREEILAEYLPFSLSGVAASVTGGRSQLRLFPGTRYWPSQLAALIACALILVGVVGPLLRYRVATTYSFNGMQFPGSNFPGARPPFFQPPPFPENSGSPPQYYPYTPLPGWPETRGDDDYSRRQYATQSMLSSVQLHLRLAAYLLVAAAIAALLLLLNLRLDSLKWLAAGIFCVVFALFAHSLYGVLFNEEVSWYRWYPTFLGQNSGAVFNWAWLPLFLSPIGLWLAARWESTPSEAEREQLFKPRLVSPSPSISVGAGAGAAATAPALPADIGLCAGCNAKNSLRATRCHACGAVLPWETARLQKSAQAAQVASQVKAQVASKMPTAGGDTSGIFLSGVLGVLVFSACSIAPFFGYFIWRHLDNEDSKYTGAAFFGWIFGAVCIVGGFLLRMILVMSRVGGMN